MDQNYNRNQNPYGNNFNQQPNGNQNPYGNNAFQSSSNGTYGNNVNQFNNTTNQYNNGNSQYNNGFNQYNNGNNQYNNGFNQYNNGQYNMNGTYSQPNQYAQGAYGNNANQGFFQNVASVASQEVVAKSFLFMFIGLLISLFAAKTVPLRSIFNMLQGGSYLLLVLVEVAVVIAGNHAISKDKPVIAAVCFTIYCYFTGAIMALLPLIYTTSSIYNILLVTSVIFAVMAVYGMVTKRDLTSLSSFLVMALIGIILASLLNVFLFKSSMLDLGISIVGVLIFVGFTAYDTQKIKNMAASRPNRSVLSLALYGGFQLYLDFINLFYKLLRIFGDRR